MKNKSARSLLKMMGPVFFAGATFVLSIILQQFEVARVFGLFAFGQVVIASMMAVSNGLFGTPLVVQIGAPNADLPSILSSFFRINFAYCIISSLIVYLLIKISDAAHGEASIVAILNFIMCFRLYLRSVVIALNKQSTAVNADLLYGVVAISVAILLVLVQPHLVTLPVVISIQITAALLSLFVFRESLWEHVSLLSKGSASVYWKSFVEQGRWAVLAVIGMQLSANSYAYFVTLLLGAAAFAPLALATLAFRPLGVILTGLVQFERPQMVRSINSINLEQLGRDVSWVRNVVFAMWMLNVSMVAILFHYFPSLLVKEGYDSAALEVAILLMAFVVVVRGMREPKAAALEAGGAFKRLAQITLMCAPLTVSGVLLILVLFPGRPELSLVGVLLAEMVNLIMVSREFTAFKLKLKQNT